MPATTQQRSTVVGVFEDRSHADAAISELRQAGFREDQIGVASRHAETGEAAETTTTGEGSHIGTGAITGALAGAGLGGLVGLGIISGVIPALGLVIAGGTLAAILANVAGGAAIGGLLGALTGAGIPEEEAHYYQGEFEAGRTLVTVTADGRYDEAVTILRRHGAYDIHTAAARGMTMAAGGQEATPQGGATSVDAITREQIANRANEIWQQRGCPPNTEQENWLEAERQLHHGAAGTPATAATMAGAAPTARTIEGSQTVQVKEEELEARKQPVETGEARVRKEVHTEHKTIEVPVQREEVVIERHAPTGRGATSDIREDEEIRVPVREEEISVEKKPVVKEEVTVGKRVVQDTARVAGDVRKEEVRVEREGDVDVRGR